MSPTININILDTCILVVNVPISIDRPDDLGHLPLEQAMVGHIMSTIHRAHDRELSNFFALNSNQNELSIYAASHIVEEIWAGTATIQLYKDKGLRISRSRWRVFQLEVDGSDIQDGALYDAHDNLRLALNRSIVAVAVARITRCLADAEIPIQVGPC